MKSEAITGISYTNNTLSELEAKCFNLWERKDKIRAMSDRKLYLAKNNGKTRVEGT